MAKKIFVLDGHPGEKSFVGDVCGAYIEGAKQAGNEIVVMKLSEMEFDMDMGDGYKTIKPLEESLLEFQKHLKWCDHFVLGHPLWWGSIPAKTKGLFDRALLPGFGFSYKEGASVQDKLLKGKTCQVLVTSDTPDWYLKLIYNRAGFQVLKKQILQFVGFAPVKFTHYSPIKGSSDKQRQSWLQGAKNLGSM